MSSAFTAITRMSFCRIIFFNVFQSSLTGGKSVHILDKQNVILLAISEDEKFRALKTGAGFILNIVAANDQVSFPGKKPRIVSGHAKHPVLLLKLSDKREQSLLVHLKSYYRTGSHKVTPLYPKCTRK